MLLGHVGGEFSKILIAFLLSLGIKGDGWAIVSGWILCRFFTTFLLRGVVGLCLIF